MDKHYLVVDLEATCDQRGFPRDQMEIIEIGAVLVEPRSLRPVREFQTFVRPVVRPWLTAFCTELTSIRQEDVDDAPLFPEALEQLLAWLQVPALLASWGAYDRNQLRTDARRHDVALPLGRDHLNLKVAFAKAAGRKPMGMRGALRLAGLPLEGTHHRGIDDARNIAKLLPFALRREALPARGRPDHRRSRR